MKIKIEGLKFRSGKKTLIYGKTDTGHLVKMTLKPDINATKFMVEYFDQEIDFDHPAIESIRRDILPGGLNGRN